MADRLIIVESPAKANTIKKFLGGSTKVVASMGHIRDLPKSKLGVDIENDFKPEYINIRGKGDLIITGSVGDVMLDSAKIALSYIKSNYKLFNIDYKLFENDIHINIPNISIKKDGPSAGVTLTTAMISALTGLKLKQNIAMTGEITLRGNVLRVGGIKEKIIGAYLNNIDIVFIPFSNIVDLDTIPNEIKEKIKFIPVKKYEEVYSMLWNIS